MPSASVTLRPGLQRNSTEPAPELETMLILLANEEICPKLRLPKVVTSLLPLPKIQPFTTVALTVSAWVFC
ncbi:hypothetical protein D3C76_1738010 [compost metagenome]